MIFGMVLKDLAVDAPIKTYIYSFILCSHEVAVVLTFTSYAVKKLLQFNLINAECTFDVLQHLKKRFELCIIFSTVQLSLHFFYLSA